MDLRIVEIVLFDYRNISTILAILFWDYLVLATVLLCHPFVCTRMYNHARFFRLTSCVRSALENNEQREVVVGHRVFASASRHRGALKNAKNLLGEYRLVPVLYRTAYL